MQGRGTASKQFFKDGLRLKNKVRKHFLNFSVFFPWIYAIIAIKHDFVIH